MRHLFYQNYKQLNGSVDPVESKSDISEALTLHPFKNHTYLYRMQSYIHGQKVKYLQKRNNKLSQDVTMIDGHLQETTIEETQRSDTNYLSVKNRENIDMWAAYKGKSLHSHKEFVPKHVIHEPELKSMVDSIFEMEKTIAQTLKKDGHLFYVKHFEHGYSKINIHSGEQYMFNLKVCCFRHKEKDDTRYIWLKRNFTDLEAIEEQLHEVQKLESKKSWVYSLTKKSTKLKGPKVNFIVPLSGKVVQFQKFIDNFENSFLKNGEDVSLFVILFWTIQKKTESENIISIVSNLQQHFPSYLIQLVQKKGDFSRGIALNIGASYFKANDLLFFVDVDCYVDRSITGRIVRNTIQGSQAYFPIMFSLYDPQFVWQRTFNFSDQTGYWRFHSYGQASLYKSDFTRIGGYDTSIRGWGKEDIDFFQRVLDKHITAFRAPDPGLIHIYHGIHCGLELPHEQYRMCLGTKWSTFGSEGMLSEIAYGTKDIINRNNDD